jgi:uncharacterized membrane protein YfcA
MGNLLLLLGAGFLAGTMNAVAGGGTFVTLPAMIFAGLPSTVANASSTVALTPALLASSFAYREDARPVEGVSIPLFLAISVVGGLIGAMLLIWTPTTTFDRLIPWLLLIATVAFTFGGRVGQWLRTRYTIGRSTLLTIQMVLSIYGGYFGGGVGIMMLAAWSLMLHADVRVLNPIRTLLVACCNAAAVVCFVIARQVSWMETLTVLVGAIAGGYGGARVARRLPQPILRGVIIAIASLMTAVFFVRAA